MNELEIKSWIISALNDHDEQRDRSKQVEIGPSQVGGCKRQVWHSYRQTEKTNKTEKLAAILGTFIHEGMAKVMEREDPFGKTLMLEKEWRAGDIKGHADLFHNGWALVLDWKTTKKKSLPYFPSERQRLQVQIYGWLLKENGQEVTQVCLVGIPRDGEMADIEVHLEPYDPEMAQLGLRWLDDIKAWAESDAPPPEPEEKVFYCRKYCEFYDPSGAIGCPSKAW